MFNLYGLGIPGFVILALTGLTSSRAEAQRYERHSGTGLSLRLGPSGVSGCIYNCDSRIADAQGGRLSIIERDGGTSVQMESAGLGRNRGQAQDALERFRPNAPFSIKIYSEAGIVLSALSELIPGTGVLIASLHSLQDLPRQVVDSAFARVNLRLRDYSGFIFLNGNRRLDAIVLVPRNFRGQDLFARQSDGSYRMQRSESFATQIAPGDHYYSHQLGIGTPGEETALQRSLGNVERVDSTFAYLPLAQGNATSAASSGSIVHILKSNTDLSRDFSLAWQVGGIIECVIPDGVANALPVRGSVRIVKLEGLRNHPAYQVTAAGIYTILSEPQAATDRACIPADRRGGGGARTAGQGARGK